MAGPGVAVPRKLAERARQISDGRLSPAVPRDAATVILLRQAASGVEAFLLRRTAELEFAPGAYVFPGGSVDARDADEDHRVGGTGPGRFWRPARRAAGPCAGAGLRGGQGDVRGVGRAAGRTLQLAGGPGQRQCRPGRGQACPADRLGVARRGARAAAAWYCAPTCSPPGPAGSRRSPRPAVSTPGSSPPRCHPGRRPRRRRRGTMRIPGSLSRAPGWAPPRRSRPRRPARSPCCRRPR